MFIDLVKIYVKAGRGGDGSTSFRREKYVPAGGPDGGDGGDGGSIILKGDSSLHTLMDYRYHSIYKAESGENGRGRKQFGKRGQDLILPVPLGTLVKDPETQGVIADICEAGAEYVLAKGGLGGKGNVHYKSSIRQAPRFAQPGQNGEEKTVYLELKMIADVGLVGYPNVGKSTLLSIMSNAKPKIANYHFTTLSPNLGVVQVEEGKSFVIADIPGLIEGASEGVGLGLEFLRHIERTRLIAHVLDISESEGRNPIEDYHRINAELEQYHLKMKNKPQVLVANKTDLNVSDELLKDVEELAKILNVPLFRVSGVTREGIQSLIYGLWNTLESVEKDYSTYDEDYVPIIEELPEFVVTKEDGYFSIQGPFAENLLYKTNFEDYESRIYFQNMLYKKGIVAQLESLGIKQGDTVLFADYEMEFSPEEEE